MDVFVSPIVDGPESPDPILPLIAAACDGAGGQAAGWRVQSSSDPRQPWIRVLSGHATPPAQGWKLHVSASAATAATVLSRALPVLLGDTANFKVAASLAALRALNSNSSWLGQIGKFITVYPNDDAQAVRLAVKLDEATRGLHGPAIRSDRPLRPGSLVHYRYGGFDGRRVQTLMGEILPAISALDGELVPDRRLPYYRKPDWATDPFLAAGAAVEPAPRQGLIHGRYYVAATIYDSPRGTVFLALDIEGPRNCVLKQARRGALEERDGVSAQDRLRHEAGVLGRLAPDPRFPAFYDLFEEDGDLFLVMEDIEGQTLEQAVNERAGQGRFVPGAQIVAWGRELAAMLAAIHAKGLVYRDLKSPNAIIAPDGRLRLLDFDATVEQGTSGDRFGRGTRGYWSPQQEADAAPTVSDDIYGLGALLYFAVTGAEPSHAPRHLVLLDRPLRSLNPAIGPELERVIVGCLEPDAARRYPTMAALDAALADIAAPAVSVPPFGGESTAEPLADAVGRYRDLASRLGDTLCHEAHAPSSGKGLAWVSTHPTVGGFASVDLNAGGAGPVLALAELVATCDQPAHREVLAQGARWLAQAPRAGGAALPGLYVGDAGVGAALLRAGQVLGDSALIAAAADHGRCVAAAPYGSPDLFNGTAGRLRFHLWLWDETGEPEHRREAIAAGESLLTAGEPADGGEWRWVIPPGYGGLSDQTYLGYAHGAAGIADALLDLYEATGTERYLEPALGAARWLRRLAVPVLADESGLNWPAKEGEEPAGAHWCHGALGIGRLFLHAAQLGVLPGAADVAARAARTVARATRRGNPTQCHGLAGSIEFLLDMFQAMRDPAYLNEARALARLLEAFALERDGLLVWPSESPDVISPDYMVGYAGVAVCLLRLADPERRPHQLSRVGFRAAGVAVPA